MTFARVWCITAVLLLCLVRQAAAESTLNLVATIKPVHSLLSAVSEGIQEPFLLLDGVVSPHQAQLKPSGVRALNNADVVVRVGPGLEGFLTNTLSKLDASVKVIELIDLADVGLLELRTGTNEEGEHDQKTGHQHSHAHDAVYDSHLWTDPVLAANLVTLLAKELSAIDVANAERYEANAVAYVSMLGRLNEELAEDLRSVQDAAFMVYHDSFQYFEKRYGLNGMGVVAWQPEVQPGASGLKQVLDDISMNQVQCLFSERQFPSRAVTMIVSESGVRHMSLDPLGSQFAKGPSMYIDWLRETANQIGECLRG